VKTNDVTILLDISIPSSGMQRCSCFKSN